MNSMSITGKSAEPHGVFVIATLVLSVFVIWGITPSSAHALDDDAYRKYMRESRDFRDAEKELNGIWKKLSESMPPIEFGLVKSAQRDWVFYIRDAKAKKLIRDQKVDAAGAYAIVTMERVRFLRLLSTGSDTGLSGRYDSGSGILTVEEMPDGKIKVHLTTDWPPQKCSGELPPAILALDGNRAVFSDDDCPRLVFVFSQDAVEVTEEERCGHHGMNCYFDGTYKKVK